MKMIYLFLIVVLFTLPTTYIQAQTVDIIWQGETYTQPFYEGKALWSSQSRVTFVAIPHGLGTPANLNYKWTKNGTVLGNVNGVGKNSISFVDSVLSRPQTIKVEIVTADKAVLASASTYIAPIRPELLVYENNPLYGFMLHKEVGVGYELRAKEITFAAFPLFFSVSDRMNQTLNYEWKSNAGGVDTRNSVTYRTPDNSTGSARITLGITSRENILQSDNKSFLLQFSNIDTDI